MYRKLALLFCVSAVSIAVSAQQTVTGKVLDKDNEGAIEGAGVAILKKADSTVVMGTQTDSRGQFQISKVKDGSYLVRVRDVAHVETFAPLEVAGKNVIMKNIMMEVKSTELDMVTVEGIAAQMVVKGDTIEYNPAAFKLADNAVVEDLLKKLPGVEVDNDGKITVNGEEIRRIRVDGKKFFDEDMLMTTRNMPADIVDKVQVLDLKSDQARLTGFEDDNTERIINLTIKEGKNKGVFGNATVGGGMDIKSKELLYNTNAFVNVWLGGIQLAVTGGANNANVARSGRGGMSGGGMSGMGGGRQSTENLGLNLNTEIGTRAVVGGDASYNHSTSTSTSFSDRYSYATAGTTETVGDNNSDRTNNSANMRAEMEWTPDSVTTLIFQPNVNVNWSKSTSGGLSDYYDVVTDSMDVVTKTHISKNKTSNEQNSVSNGGGLSLTFSRRSAVKRGRSLTISTSGSFSNSDNDGYQNNRKETYRPNGDTLVTLVDQLTQGKSNSYNANVNVSFVEPLFNTNNSLQLSIQLRTNGSESESMKFNKDPFGVYNRLDSTYSNISTSSRSNERIQLTYQYRETNSRYNYSFGIAADPYQTYTNANYFKGTDRVVNETGINFSPNARLRYNLIPTTGQTNAMTGGRNRSYVEMSYSGSTRQPSPEQMQPGKNNSNLMSETVGNPDLTPEFSQQMSFSFSHNNAEKMSNITASVSGSFTQNALVSNSITDETRKTWRQTVNVTEDIPFSTNASFTFNAPVFKNRLQFNSNTSGNFAQSFNYSDQSGTENPFADADSTVLRLAEKGVTNRWGANERISLTFTTDWLEIGANVNIRYSGSQNSLNGNKVTETFDFTPSGNLSLYLPYSWVITNDLGYTGRSGYGSLTKNELIWNAVISKPIFNNLGTLSLNLYDILQQRQNISESVSENSRSFSRSNTLTSYFMLSFTYRISQFGGAGGGRGGFGGGMRGGMRGGMGGMGGMGGGRF